MDEGDVYPLDRHALERVLERAHRAVIGIVKLDGKGRRIDPGREIDAVARCRVQQAPDLGGDDIVLARLPAQSLPEAQFGKPMTVERRRIEIADARRPGPLDHGGGCFLADRSEEIADWRRAKSHIGDGKTGASESTSLDRH